MDKRISDRGSGLRHPDLYAISSSPLTCPKDKAPLAAVKKTWPFGSYLKVRRFYHRCSKLAYQKHHLERFQDAETGLVVEVLRQEIGGLSQEILTGRLARFTAQLNQ